MFFEVLSIPPIPCLDRDSQGLRIVSELSSLAKETLVDLSKIWSLKIQWMIIISQLNLLETHISGQRHLPYHPMLLVISHEYPAKYSTKWLGRHITSLVESHEMIDKHPHPNLQGCFNSM